MKKQTTALRRRRFERVVVLVDITIVLLQDEPKRFAAHIFNSVSNILQQCNEHSKFSTLWGYKFFDPFHPPMASRSKIGEFLGGTPMSEQFDAFALTLEKFGRVLKRMVENHGQYSSEGSSRGDYVARAINEVICGGNYTWDPLLASDSSSSDEGNGGPLASKERLGGEVAKRDSNAIILFSSVPTTWTGANRFFNVPQIVGDALPDPSAQGPLDKTFRAVSEALKSNNMQVCFVDVPMHQDWWSDERLETVLKPTAARSLVLKSLSGLVRTVIASDLLVVSPRLLPRNLVWNTMADLGIDRSSKRSHARILCPGATLLCEVQLQTFSVVRAPSTSRGTFFPKTRLFPATDPLDIVLESVHPKSSLNMKHTSERFLIRQSVRPRTSTLDNKDSFGDKVLQLLDQSAFRPGQPEWQLLLLTLASQKSVCEVSLRIQENGQSLRAIVEPFTSQCAILTVFEKEITLVKTDRLATIKIETKEESEPREGVNVMKRRKDAADCRKHEGVTVIPSRKRRRVAASDEAAIDWKEYWEREGSISASPELTSDYGTVLSRYIEGGKASDGLQTMDRFLKEMPKPNTVNGSGGPLAVMDVGVELSADQECTPAARPDSDDAVVLPGTVSGRNIEAIALDDVQVQDFGELRALVETTVQEDSNPAVDVNTSAKEGDPTSSVASQMIAEEAEEYIASVGQKIEDYLTSADVDSPRFAEMLVAESHRSFSVLLTGQTEDDQERSDTGEPDLKRIIAKKLKKLLLKSHKRLLAKYKDCVGSPCRTTSGVNVDDKVKEHELQILLRLEMISFDEGRLLEQTAQEHLVEDVCKLLDSIQFHLDGGLFGGKGLPKYCDRLLASRYRQRISSTISKIYSIMELDGYPALPPTSPGELLLSEAGSSQVSTAWSESFLTSATNDGPSGRISASATSDVQSGRLPSSATTDVPSGSSDPEHAALQPTLEKNSKRKSRDDSNGQVQPFISEKGQKKKGSYHFASHATLLRIRKFKPGARHISIHLKPSKGCRTSVSVKDDPVQIVYQTPAPMTAPSSRGAGDMPKPATLGPSAVEFRARSPAHQRVSVEQPPSVVEGTPVVRRRLTLHNLGRESSLGGDIGLDAFEPVMNFYLPGLDFSD